MLTDPAYLLDLLNEARIVLKLVDGMSYGEFIQDLRTTKAVERSFEILGTAVKGLSPEFRAAHPELPWRWMIDTRNVIAHQYKKVNHALLWETIQVDIPELIRLLEPLVPPETN